MRSPSPAWLTAVWVGAWAVFSFPWTSATSTAHWERFRPPYVRPQSRIRLDHVLDVAFYLPAAPLAAALGWPVAAGVSTGAAMSVVAEGSQLFSSDRAPEGNDLIANVGGALAGSVGVLLYRRKSRR